jgi:hypothetical protein
MRSLLSELHRTFGWRSRLSAAVGGPYLARKIRAEAKRLAEGWTYEPPTFYERNREAELLAGERETAKAAPCQYVTAATAPTTAVAAVKIEPEPSSTSELLKVID